MKSKIFLLVITLLLVMTSVFACQSDLPISPSEETTDTPATDTPQTEASTVLLETQATTDAETAEPSENTAEPSENTAELKKKVYATLDQINFELDMFLSTFPMANLDETLYETYFVPLGKEAVPYILQYVMESPYSALPENRSGSYPWEGEFYDSCYFVAAAYALIGRMSFFEAEWYGFHPWIQEDAPWIPRFYAAQLYEHLHEHIDTDPAEWGTYTPAEGALSRDETLPPVIYTDPKV